jgi:hypothetical protein
MALSAAGHSLMALLLNANPDITHLGDTVLERHLFEKGRCSCGAQYRNCGFWRQTCAWEGFEFLRSGFPRRILEKVAFYHPRLHPVQKMASQVFPDMGKYSRNLIAFVSFLKTTCGSRQVVYGRKRIADLLLLLASPNSRVRIIHLTKHPMAQVISFRKRKARQGESIESFAKKWVHYNSRVYYCQFKGSCSGYFHLRYEDLCQAPEEMLGHLCGFLETEYHDNMMHPDRSEHHIVGAKSLVGEPGEPFTGIRVPDLKMDILSVGEKKAVWRITQTLAERLGYRYP